MDPQIIIRNRIRLFKLESDDFKELDPVVNSFVFSETCLVFFPSCTPAVVLKIMMVTILTIMIYYVIYNNDNNNNIIRNWMCLLKWLTTVKVYLMARLSTSYEAWFHHRCSGTSSQLYYMIFVCVIFSQKDKKMFYLQIRYFKIQISFWFGAWYKWKEENNEHRQIPRPSLRNTKSRSQ